MPHSFKLENEMLLDRLDQYKEKIGYLERRYEELP